MTTRERNKKTALLVMSMLVTGVFSACATSHTEEDNMIIVEQEEAPAEYSLVAATLSDVVLTQNIRCTYAQLDASEYQFEVSGKLVEKVYVEKGDAVEKGQLLAELSGGKKEDEMARLEYQISRNKLLLEQLEESENYEISRRWLEYLYKSQHSADTEKALKEGIAGLQQSNQYTREDYEDAIRLDELQLSVLRQEEKQSRMYADAAGVVSYVRGDLEGSTSNRDEIVLEVMDNSQCLFVAENMTYASHIREGQELDMQIVAGNSAGKYKMRPYQIEEWQDKMLFTVVGGEEIAIEAGTSGNLTLVLGERSQVLALPTAAVHNAGEEYYVYVMDDDNIRQVKWVGIGLWGDSYVEITQGLEEGEKVVLK
ncbi:MAG: biotin/lipoyl-binding protein [Roseburia sp.]|nr:biotin/lipoyl-binding protein [Roseburia sp.]